VAGASAFSAVASVCSSATTNGGERVGKRSATLAMCTFSVTLSWIRI
jgi:hypothetical protein